MKKFRILFILLFTLFLLGGCQQTQKPIETEEPTIETPPPSFDYTTLDGTYYLIMSSDTSVNRTKDMKVEEPFISYEMTITGNELVETYHLGSGSSTRTYQIDIAEDLFSIADDIRTFYIDIEKGIVEVFMPRNNQGTYYALLAKDKDLDPHLTTYDGYYMIEEVIGSELASLPPYQYVIDYNYAMYHEFTLDFTIENDVTISISPKNGLAETLFGTYIATEHMILVVFDNHDMLFLMDDDGYLVYFEHEDIASYGDEYIMFSHQTDKQNPIYTIYPHRNYDYSNSETFKDELTQALDAARLNFDENYNIIEYYKNYPMDIMHPYAVYGDDLFAIGDAQSYLLKDYQTSNIGLVIDEDFVLGTYLSAPYPDYDIVSHLSYEYQITKIEGDHFLIKVSPNTFFNDQFLFVHPYDLKYIKAQLMGYLYIEVVITDESVGYVLYNERFENLGTVTFTYEDLFEIDFSDLTQDAATNIEAAIIPMAFGETYSLTYEQVPYENYYLLELEAGSYEIQHTPYRVDFSLLDEHGLPFDTTIYRYSYRDDRFAFKIDEPMTLYLKGVHDTYYKQGYDVTLNQIDEIGATPLEVINGESYHVDITSVFVYRTIELTEPVPQGYHVVFIPDNPKEPFISILDATYFGERERLDEYYVVDALEPFTVAIHASGTIMIEKVDDDAYGASASSPYNLNSVIDEVFVASTHYPQDVFQYTHVEGAFMINATANVVITIKDELGVTQTMPIETPGVYEITVSIPYSNYYTSYQLNVNKALTEPKTLVEADYIHQGYYIKGIPQIFEIDLTEPTLIELITDVPYALKILDNAGTQILGNIEKAAFTLMAGHYQIIFDNYEDTTFKLEYHNHGVSTKPAINQDVSSLPLSLNLTFDFPHEIFLFNFKLEDNEFIKVSGDVLFNTYSYGYIDNELVPGVNYGFGNRSIEIIVRQDQLSQASIQFTHRFM
jgi:hypothetical protein